MIHAAALAGAEAVPLVQPEWPVPSSIAAAMSLRRSGVPGLTDEFNLPGPDPQAVPGTVGAQHRRFAEALGLEPVWMRQVHGAQVQVLEGPVPAWSLEGDAAVTAVPGVACTVRVADCLPALLCDASGRAVGAAHAGWRGLAAGVLENTVRALCGLADCSPSDVRVWLGPCIGPQAFEVGAEVLEAFGRVPLAQDLPGFQWSPRRDGTPRWLANLHLLARERLALAGVRAVEGLNRCTVAEPEAFFSFRRDRSAGRMAAAVGLRLG